MDLMPSKVKEIEVVEPKPYHISINNHGVIEIAFFGVQTVETMDNALDALTPVMQEIRRQGRPVNLLADNAGVSRTTTAANQRVLQAYKTMQFHKAAGINANPVLRFVLNTIIRTAGLSSRVKLFHDRAAAENWLLEP